jgi:CheY-like chemotaxis protein
MAIRRRKTADKRVSQDDAGLSDELAILRAVLSHYPPGTQLFFGSPSRCPECGDYGLVGHVAHDTGRCTNSCRVCRRDWVITKRALRAHRETPVAPKPVGRGVLYEALVAAETAAAEPPIEPPAESVVEQPIESVVEPPTESSEPVAPAPPAPEPRAEAPAPAAPAPQAPAPAAPVPVVDLSSEPTGPLAVLVVEDNPFDLTVVEDLLEPYLSSDEVQITHCPTRAEAEHATMSRSFDVVLLDLDLPDSRGLTTLLEWQHHVPTRMPIVVLTEALDSELIRGARALGVSQVIHRPQLEQLATQGPAGQDRLYKLLRKTAAAGAAASAMASGPRA